MINDLPFQERRKHVCLSDEQMDMLVNVVSERVVSQVGEQMKNVIYREIGKSIVDKGLWIIGIVAVGMYAWLNAHGFLEGK